MMRELSLQNCRLDERYDITRRLGRGSYAEIFLAVDNLAHSDSPHRQVVIKALNVFMNNDLDSDLERTLLENFENEAVALDRVRHPNIICRLGHGTSRDLQGIVFHYLVLEYLPGGDLAGLCRKKPLPLRAGLDYLEQVCAGLAFAHENGIIHRDIKPQNLLLSADRSIVKIADFGVARISDTDGPITRVGTNIYAPPEHSPMSAGMTGRLPHSVLTPAADIYSLAKTAYVLITSESPRIFSNQPITALPLAVRKQPWAGRLIGILSRATRTDPRDRFRNIREFWNELSTLGDHMVPLQPSPALRPNSTVRSSPAPLVSRGFSAELPDRATFGAPGDPEFPELLSRIPNAGLKAPDPKPEGFARQMAAPPGRQGASHANGPAQDPGGTGGSSKRPRLFRDLAVIAILVGLFAGGIFLTYNLVLNADLLNSAGSLFTYREATALMNINLRPDPSTRNPRIGLVTKHSRLRIIENRGHWYHVDVVKYGRRKTNPGFADRGWISGKTRTGNATIRLRGKR